MLYKCFLSVFTRNRACAYVSLSVNFVYEADNNRNKHSFTLGPDFEEAVRRSGRTEVQHAPGRGGRSCFRTLRAALAQPGEPGGANWCGIRYAHLGRPSHHALARCSCDVGGNQQNACRDNTSKTGSRARPEEGV